MGYISCAAIALYGTKEKVELVDNLLLQRLTPEYDRDLFERLKQVVDTDEERMIVWTFDDIKWYADMDAYKDMLFTWVEEINDATPDHEKNFRLAVDFVRVGESAEDNEEQFSSDSEYALSITRRIELPDNFTWRC